MLFLWLGRDVLLAWNATTRGIGTLVEHKLRKPALNWAQERLLGYVSHYDNCIHIPIVHPV